MRTEGAGCVVFPPFDLLASFYSSISLLESPQAGELSCASGSRTATAGVRRDRRPGFRRSQVLANEELADAMRGDRSSPLQAVASRLSSCGRAERGK